jgi:hypothetical protein
MVLNQNDYYVRVLMNDLLLRLDDTNEQHIEFVNRLIDYMMESNERPELYEGVYTNTALHRFKVRSNRVGLSSSHTHTVFLDPVMV